MEFRRQVVHHPETELAYCHAATLVELGDGTVLCAWYGAENGCDSAIYGAELAPGGTTWAERGVLTKTTEFSEGNPALLRDAGGRLWLFFVTRIGERWDTCQVKYCHSTDEGKTWSSPYFLRADWGWMTGCKPLLREDGEILLPLYEERSGAFVLRSEGAGRFWEASNVVNTEAGVIQPTIAPLSGERLLMYLRTYEQDGRTLWQSVSEDGGRTWGAPARVELPNPSARVDLTRLQSGRLALAFNDSATTRTPLTLALSEDEGRTWPIRLDVETEEKEYSYPALIQSRDGLLHLAYTYEHTHIWHIACDEEYVLAHGRRVAS